MEKLRSTMCSSVFWHGKWKLQQQKNPHIQPKKVKHKIKSSVAINNQEVRIEHKMVNYLCGCL